MNKEIPEIVSRMVGELEYDPSTGFEWRPSCKLVM